MHWWYGILAVLIAWGWYKRGFKAGVKSKEHEFKWGCPKCPLTFTSTHHDVLLRIADMHDEIHKES